MKVQRLVRFLLFYCHIRETYGDGCASKDSRDVLWQGDIGQMVTKRCSDLDQNLIGSSYWTCISGGNSNYFNSTEPNRSECEELFKM